MAAVNIDMLLTDSTRSIRRRANEVRALNTELERTVALAGQAGGAPAPMSGSSRRSAFSAQGAASGAPGVPSGSAIEDYNRSRGTVGTGAAGRDFANQAQGLGGVVRLYATFAANIFAVGAAFSALQQAANFDRLIKASELMSERTGVNLKGLGKALQEATGYAISFEDSMQFANLGTSAGIAAKDLEELVKIAKGAAAGLGRDVQDSVRRIIQGTAKQEQEILDELGIFIKAKDAYEEYAKKFEITGGADALSAQQRVAAYADAVKKAGEKWKEFAELDDPFSRFVATGKEALNTILNFINSAIIPLIRFLADSKGAVIALALAISASLAKRALPGVKDSIVNFFNYDRARLTAAAQEQRLALSREFAQTSDVVRTKQAELAQLQNNPAFTPTLLRGSFDPAMLARTNAAGAAVGMGIAPKKLEQSIFGTANRPIDLASYQKVEDVEKAIKKAVDATIGSNQVKLDQMKQMGIITQTSILGQTQLTAATQAAAQRVFDGIKAQNLSLEQQAALRAEILALTNQQAQRQAQLTNLERGSGVRATDRLAPPPLVGPPRPAPVPTAPSILSTIPGGTAVAGFATAGLDKVKAAYEGTKASVVSAVAEIGKNHKQMESVVGGSFTETLKQAGIVLKNHGQIIGGFSRDVYTSGRMMLGAGNAATFWAAASTAGFSAVKAGAAAAAAAISVLGLALKGLMAAFGPVMILWTMWELLGKNLLPASTRATMEFNNKVNELKDSLALSAIALNNANKMFAKGITDSKEYGLYLDIISSAIRSQIDAFKELQKERDKADKPKILQEARKQYEELGLVFSEQIFNIDTLLTTLNQQGQGNSQAANALRNIRAEFESIAIAENNARQGLDEYGNRINSITEDLTQFLTKSTVRYYNVIPSLFGIGKTPEEIDKAAASLRNFFGVLTAGEEAALRRQGPAAARAQRNLEATAAPTEQERALKATLDNSKKLADTTVEDIKKKLKGVSDFGKLAQNEVAQNLAKVFEPFAAAFSAGKITAQNVAPYYNQLKGIIDSLAPTSEAAAQAQLALNAAQANNLPDLQKYIIALKLIPEILQDYNRLFNEYKDSAIASFLSQVDAIEALKRQLISLDMQMAQSNAFTARTEAMRGFATQAEIAVRTQDKINKADKEYQKGLKETNLELDKVLQKRGNVATITSERTGRVLGSTLSKEAQEAQKKADTRKQELALQRDQQILSARLEEIEQVRTANLAKISIEYEKINRLQEIQNTKLRANLDFETQRLAVLREAGALSEPQLVARETDLQQQTTIQSYNEQTSAAKRAREEAEKRARVELDAALDLANKNTDLLKSEQQKTDASNAYGVALKLAADKENDALILARLTRDSSLATLRLTSQAKIAYAELADEIKTVSDAEARRLQRTETANQLQDVEKQKLDFLRDLGYINDTVYNKEVQAIGRVTRAQEYNNKIIALAIDYRNKLRTLDTQETVARAAIVQKDAAGNVFVDETQAAQVRGRFKGLRDEARAAYDEGVLGARRVYDANNNLIDSINSVGETQKGLAAIYKSTFQGMADSLLDFVLEGKNSFKDLINDMLKQIARLYVRNIFMNMFSAVAPMLPFMPATGPTTGGGPVGGTGIKFSRAKGAAYDGGIEYYAKGMAFDNGLTRYAKGGTFTNSIVNTPTVFKFAKGTGLMGEAGPEAIMPLKRDNQGNLGVRSTNTPPPATKVDVVVNNYGSEKAETRETVDGRGNRKIEVVIGDIAAGEIARSGSQTNRAIQSTFGLTPQLIRR